MRVRKSGCSGAAIGAFFVASIAAAQQAIEVQNGRGADGYVRVADSAALEPQRFTIDLAFRPLGPGSGRETDGAGVTLFAKPREDVFGTYIFSWWMGWSSVTGRVSALVSANGSGSGVSVQSPCVIALGQTARATMTFDGAVLRLYIDGGGVVEAPAAFTDVYYGPDDVLVGAANFALGYLRRFDGAIDNVSLWDRALDATEVADLDGAALSGAEPGLIALWTFDDGTLIDATGHGHDGVAQGAVLPTGQLAPPGVSPCAACPADLDGDGALTIFDFLLFQNLFDAGDPAADFDGDGSLTIFDFLAFQNAFDAGC